MTIGLHRPTTIYIDQQAIYDNVKNSYAYLNTQLHDESELFAVVKADGYGHGAIPVAQVARDAGATGFCVSLLDEALTLRGAGFSEPILVMGIVEAKYAAMAIEENISLIVASLDWLKEAEAFLVLEKITQPLSLHIAFDSGMNRIGFKSVIEVSEAISLIEESSYFQFDGIGMHFATADELDVAYFLAQKEKFDGLFADLTEKPRYIHVSNSATLLWHPTSYANMVRLGISMYGLNPSGKEMTLPFKLKPALSLETELVFVKEIKKNEAVGYGATYLAEKDEWIGTLPIGYADGWPRSLQGFYVLVEGQKCEIVGRICMDQCMIRLPKKMPVGTKVTLVGKNGSEEITLQDIADHEQTIHYEICCGFGQRIPRVYLPYKKE